MRRPTEWRFGVIKRTLWTMGFGRSEPASADDPAGVVELLEAINSGDTADIFRRAVEKDMREQIDRSRRLRGELALAPEVADPIVAEALDSLLANHRGGNADSSRRGVDPPEP